MLPNRTVRPCIFFLVLSIWDTIIKRSLQCKAGREWFTPYQSRDPSPTIPTYRQKEEKGKNSWRQKGIKQRRWIKKGLALLLKPTSPTPSNTGSARLLHRDTEIGIKVLLLMRYYKVMQRLSVYCHAARRRISILMCYQSTACNPHWHIRHRSSALERVHWVPPDLI